MKRGDSGFTLLEVLVSMFLTAMVGATVTSTMVFTTNVVGENTLAAEAIALAQEALENLRTYPYEEIDSGSEASEDGIYTISRAVIDDSPEQGMKRIDVTVSWDWKGQARSYELHTVYSKINKT